MENQSLFPNHASWMSGAEFSDCKQYRYTLTRAWNKFRPTLNFIMLNPSTADEYKNDPTVERCHRRAATLGFGRLVVTNIFAYRSTNPKVLKLIDDPIGPENDVAIIREARNADMVICGWGNHGTHRERGDVVMGMLSRIGARPHALRVTKQGQPEHPLYISYETEPRPVDVWDIKRGAESDAKPV